MDALENRILRRQERNSMERKQIGKIERVSLRSIWPHEARDFTVWLMENIDVLNSALDFHLVNPEREKSAGDFNVDLVAEDEDGNLVVIENQLEKSNHDHLGKVVTYLSAVGASKAIWIVAEPKQEHVKAMSWLNESSSSEFYLLKIEGIKIEGSLPAPLFTLIVGPSDEVRGAGATKKEYAERHQIRNRFWTLLLEKAKAKTKLHANISPGMYSWVGTGSGIRGVTYNYVVGQHDSKVELYIDKGTAAENKEIFDKLKDKKETIERSFGGRLSWERLDTKRASRIARHFEKGGYRDEANWEAIADVMIDAMIALERSLSPLIARMK